MAIGTTIGRRTEGLYAPERNSPMTAQRGPRNVPWGSGGGRRRGGGTDVLLPRAVVDVAGENECVPACRGVDRCPTRGDGTAVDRDVGDREQPGERVQTLQEGRHLPRSEEHTSELQSLR